MLVLALSRKGAEFSYAPSTARKVSKASAETICKIANEHKFLYECYPNCVWHPHEVYPVDRAYEYAQHQSFTIRNGVVSARNK